MMKVSKVIIAMLFAMVLCAFGRVDAVAPGIQSGISTAAVQKLVNKVLPPVINMVKHAQYPDMSDEQKKQKAYIYHPTFQSLSVGSFVAQVKDNKFTVGIRDFHIDLKAGWRVKIKKLVWVSTHGNVEVRFSASQILASFVFGTRNVNNVLKPTVAVADVAVDVTTAKVKLSHNIFAWLFNMVTSFFKNKIRNFVNTAIRDAVRNGLTAAASKMTDAIPSSAPMGALGSIALGLTSGMYFVNNNVIALPFDGTITSSNGIVGSAPRHNVPFIATGRMLDLYLDTYVFNSGADATFKSKNFNVNYIATSLRHPSIAFDLVGSTLGLEQLDAAGHGHKLLRIRAVPAVALTVNSAPGAFSASQALDIAFDLNLGNGNFLEALVVRATGSGSVNLTFSQINGTPHLVPHLNGLSASFVQIRSAFGNVTFAKLNNFIAQVLNGLVVPVINTTVLQPIPIPTTTGLVLANPSIQFKQDHVYAGFDVDFIL